MNNSVGKRDCLLYRNTADLDREPAIGTRPCEHPPPASGAIREGRTFFVLFGDHVMQARFVGGLDRDGNRRQDKVLSFVPPLRLLRLEGRSNHLGVNFASRLVCCDERSRLRPPTTKTKEKVTNQMKKEFAKWKPPQNECCY